jgi:cobalt/nickel transport protein
VRKTTGFLLTGLVVALLLAGVVSNFASGAPDGLDSASTKGCTTGADGEITGGTCIAQGARDHELGDSPLADYGVRGVDNGFLATGLAGVAGVLLTFAVAGGLFWLARSRRPVTPGDPGANSPGRPGPGVPAARE